MLGIELPPYQTSTSHHVLNANISTQLHSFPYLHLEHPEDFGLATVFAWILLEVSERNLEIIGSIDSELAADSESRPRARWVEEARFRMCQMFVATYAY